MSVFTGGFPTAVNVQQAPAVAGDFASINPRYTVLHGQGAFVAGAQGTTVGAFCWADPINPNSVDSFGTGPVTGFVGRAGQRADIIQYLANSSMAIIQGMPTTVYSGGDFWIKNNGAAAVTIGMKAYALFASGLAVFAATGTPPVSATASAATLAKIVSASTGASLPTTNTATGGISGTTLTISAVGSGSVVGPGPISGTGIDPATQIIQQLTGTAEALGTYQVNVSQTVAAGTAITLPGGGLALAGSNVTGIFTVGMSITGTDIPAGTFITALGTGTGGAGTYQTNQVAGTAASGVQITASNAMFLTVDSSSSGVWALNDVLTGSGVSAGLYISQTGAQNAGLTGLGGQGTYLVGGFQSSALSAQTISVNSGVETKWIAMTTAAVGELVQISSQPLG